MLSLSKHYRTYRSVAMRLLRCAMLALPVNAKPSRAKREPFTHAASDLRQRR